MNQTRSFLLIAWLAVAFMLFTQWQKPNEPAVSAANAAASADVVSTKANTANTANDMPSIPSKTTVVSSVSDLPVVDGEVNQGTQAISIETDVLKLGVDLHGVSLISAELLKYPLEKKAGSPKVVLEDNSEDKFYVAQSGLLSATPTQANAPTHKALFQTENKQSSYRLSEAQNTLEIPFLWQDAQTGLRVRKTLVFTRGSYAIKVRQEISNSGVKPWQGFAYEQFIRTPPPALATHSMFTNPETFSLMGVAWYSEQNKFEKKKFPNFKADDQKQENLSHSWISMVQHYFVSAWLPNPNDIRTISTEILQENGKPRYRINSIGSVFEVAAGKTKTMDSTLWVGPKTQEQLEKIDPSLKLTLDYGYLSVIAQPLFWLLSLLHSWLGNWGWSIIAIVVLLKLALYKLSAAQYKSMAKMRAIQPRLEALKERYGDDRQQYSAAMMDLYKKEKINPAGGCLPMLIPLPIFFALYWVLLESVELRQAPWMGWIQNLTAPDPYFILPVMNLIIMFVTQRLTPMPGMDPLQKKIMQFMPLMFGVLMAFFPAGLVLYWVTNGLLGIIQQQAITKRHGEKPATAK